MKLFGVDIVEDESLLPSAFKMVNSEGDEVVFVDGKQVIEEV